VKGEVCTWEAVEAVSGGVVNGGVVHDLLAVCQELLPAGVPVKLSVDKQHVHQLSMNHWPWASKKAFPHISTYPQDAAPCMGRC